MYVFPAHSAKRPPCLSHNSAATSTLLSFACMRLLAAKCTQTLRRFTGSRQNIRPRRYMSDKPAILAGMDAGAAAPSSASSSSPPAVKVPTIQLEDRESAVLDLVDGFTKHLAKTRPDLPLVECRVAGGWVRDKVSCSSRPALC